jgi:hypothetical protein
MTCIPAYLHEHGSRAGGGPTESVLSKRKIFEENIIIASNLVSLSISSLLSCCCCCLRSALPLCVARSACSAELLHCAPLYGCRSVGGGSNYQNGSSSGAHGALSSFHISLIISLSETYGFCCCRCCGLGCCSQLCTAHTLQVSQNVIFPRIFFSKMAWIVRKIHSC